MAAVRKTASAFLGLVFFFVLSPLYLAQNLWSHYVLGRPSAGSVLEEVYAEVLATVDEALRTFLPEADSIDEEIRELTDDQMARVESEAEITLDPRYGRRYYFYVGKKQGAVVGYAAADSVQGKWGPIDYMVAFTPEGEIKDIMVIAYHERRGRPVAKNRFLKQFFGKTAADDIQLMKDIRGVTGASISSRGMTDGIRKLTHIFKVLYGK